jgi:CubicO group peptidase (beta-lactamase class C family)
MKAFGRVWISWLLVFCSVGCLGNGPEATTQRSAVAVSQEAFGRITSLMEREVEQGKLAGAVAIVAVDGDVVYQAAVGKRDREAAADMQFDSVFRIASMSKPITSVAAMILYEQGKIALDDPVSKYIPEFANPRVLTADGRVLPAEREITVRDLLTHTSGLTYQWDSRIGPLYNAAGITAGIVEDDGVLGEKMAKLGRIPLLHQPGAAWTYGLNTDVLGRVVEVASGQTLAEFMAERIFRPLGMKDSFFFVPEHKMGRLAAAYAPAAGGGLKRLRSEMIREGTLTYCADHPYAGKRRYYSGGGGLCSTAPDYLRFAQMLANGGVLDGRRLLKAETVAMMTTDQVGDRRPGGEGFGLGFGVTRDSAEARKMGCVGSYGWGGFWYTTFFADPARNLVGVSMAQLHPGGSSTLNGAFKGLVYAAIE